MLFRSQLNTWLDDVDDVAIRTRNPVLFPNAFIGAYSQLLDMEVCHDLDVANQKALLRNAWYIYARKGTKLAVKRFVSKC